MAKRKEELHQEEFYHVYNRGVDKRTVFEDKQDFFQFYQMLELFNNVDSLGGIEKYKYPKNLRTQQGESKVLVEVHAYCLNPNHFHLILKQKVEGGISKFMQKVGTGYTNYFNNKNSRSGVLFQGRFKSKWIDTQRYLNHLSVYVNLNYQVHKLPVGKYRSSYQEYLKEREGFCFTEDIMNSFKSVNEYKAFAERQIKFIGGNREERSEVEFQ